MEILATGKAALPQGTQTASSANSASATAFSAAAKTVQTNPASVVTLAPEVKGTPVERREEKLGRQFEEPVSAQQAIESLRLTSRRTQVDFDIELNTIFLQIIDTRTEEVVDTIPPEELVRELRAKLKPSDQTPLDETGGIVVDRTI